MTIFTKNLKQSGTYWGSPVEDGYGGFTFATPVAINCRWELKQELFIDGKGKEKVSAAIVYLEQDIDLGGYLYLGTSAESNPKDVEGSYTIKSFSKIPDIKGTSFTRKVWL